MGQAGGYVVVPNWLADGSRFWYEDTQLSERREPVRTTIYLVDPAANTVTELFDRDRLRRAIRDVLGHEPEPEGIPFRAFEFTNDEETAVRFEVEGRTFELDLGTYDLTPLEPDSIPAGGMPGRCGGDMASEAVPSPDGRWVACVLDHDVWLVSSASGREMQVTSGGSEEYGWHIGADPDRSGTAWSPDGAYLLLQREDLRDVPRIPIVHWLMDPPSVEWVMPGSATIRPKVELHVLDTDAFELRKVDLGEPAPWWIGVLAWRPDGSEVVFEPATRAGLQEDLLALNPATSVSRLLHSEASDAPVLVNLMWYGQVAGTLLSGGKRLLFVSEDSGSLQLYLQELDSGDTRQLSPGPYPVIRLVGVDEEVGWVYYTAFGDPERPYDAHLYRVRLDGSGLSRLTDLGANHEPTGMAYWFLQRRTGVHLSPSREYFVARRSTPERLPVMELRRTDGTLVCVLARASLGPAAAEYRWTPPEEFTVKAADDVTDLWGVLWKPYDFDPARMYPVIELFYNEQVPRTFDPTPYGVMADQLAQLGFITVMMEGRGATGRGRAFRNAFQGQPGAFIDDHAAALRNLARERPFMDLSRVGAFGHSAGGDDVLWAMVRAPDTYHAGVSGAPVTSPSPEVNEALLASVPNLEGRLFLIHGTADSAAPLSMTMRFIDACVRAGKRVDLLLVPDAGHGIGGGILMDRAADFFVEQLRPYEEGPLTSRPGHTQP